MPARLAEQALVQRTGQLMYEWSLRHPAVSGIQPAYAWTATRVTGRDGLPIAGAHRNFPHHLFALGLGATGLAGAWLAARIVLRQYQGEPDPATRSSASAACSPNPYTCPQLARGRPLGGRPRLFCSYFVRALTCALARRNTLCPSLKHTVVDSRREFVRDADPS